MKLLWFSFLLLTCLKLAELKSTKQSLNEAATKLPLNSKISLPNTEQLDDEGKVYMGWEVDSTTEIITFEIEALTTGYVGFGISPQGSMLGADIFTAGVLPNGTVYSAVSL